jgi:hypothetical protein
VPYAKSSSAGERRAARLAGLDKPLQRFERAARIDGEAADLHEADAARAVDDERHALGEIPRVVPDTEPAAHATGWLHVAQETKRQVERFGPRQVPLRRIDGDPDDLGVQRRELRLVIPEPGELALSAAGERLHVEGDDDEVALDEGVAQAEGPTMLIGQDDGRCRLADGERLVPVGRKRRCRQQRDQEQNQPAQGVSTAWSTAPRKSGSGTAPSNWTRSLITTFGTPIT